MKNSKKILITGGAGFIGSNLIHHIINNTQHSVLNIDKLTYAGNLESLDSIENSPRYLFNKIDICNKEQIGKAIVIFKPEIIIHLAAESHVDRSIENPDDFIQTNIFGTYNLLEAARKYWETLEKNLKEDFRFHHVSTDEVYGDLKNLDLLFTEESSYAPSSPYSASKASSDHLVRAWFRTYGLPIIITNCSNNYGPYQFPEKLIPLIILKALEGQKLPIYGDGKQIRDWLYVDDHAKAILSAAINGKKGETYNIGGHNEIKNIDLVKIICSILDELAPNHNIGVNNYAELITFVADRSGHDSRYAIDATKMDKDLGWTPDETLLSGIRKTVQWYLDNLIWSRSVQNKETEGKN